MEQPIGFNKMGGAVYDNTPTVVCVLAWHHLGLVTIRRANSPGYNKLALPGGYQMRGESWQNAGAREFYEETGLVLKPEKLKLRSLFTDEYDNNVLFATYGVETGKEAKCRSDWPPDGETLSTVYLTKVGPLADWAFPLHWQEAASIL